MIDEVCFGSQADTRRYVIRLHTDCTHSTDHRYCSMYAQFVLSPQFLMLRASANALRWFAAGLAAIAFVLAVSFSPQDPEGCHPEKQAHPTPEPFPMAQTVSPTTVNPFNQCPGGHSFNVKSH